jgi:phospholipid-binding lipoprotein MlaA
LYYVDKRARLLVGDDALANAFDPYIFLRDAYLQRRRYLVYDGDPPSLEEDFEDVYSEEDFLTDD